MTEMLKFIDSQIFAFSTDFNLNLYLILWVLTIKTFSEKKIMYIQVTTVVISKLSVYSVSVKLGNSIYIYIYIYIYIMRISSKELSVLVSDCVKCKQKKVNTYSLNSQDAVASPTGESYVKGLM